MYRKIGCVILIFLLSALMLSACGGETPEQAVTNALTAVKNSDMGTIRKYCSYSDLVQKDKFADVIADDEDKLELLFEQLSFEVVSSAVNGRTAAVKVITANVNMTTVMNEHLSQTLELAMKNALAEEPLSDEDMKFKSEQILVELLEQEDNEKFWSIIDIKLTKKLSGWKMDIDEEFRDAIFGGLYTWTEKRSEMNNEVPVGILDMAHDFVNSDIRNNGFAPIIMYIYHGTGNKGKRLDFSLFMQQFAVSMEKKAEFDQYISGLDMEYSDVKQKWQRLSSETDKLYTQLILNYPAAGDSSYAFEINQFDQYMWDFFHEVMQLVYFWEDCH